MNEAVKPNKVLRNYYSKSLFLFSYKVQKRHKLIIKSDSSFDNSMLNKY